MSTLRGADLLADAVIAAGIDTIFGVPGDTGVIFYDALHARSDRLQHVLARDERHAGAMADAYARVTNRVGAVEVSSGGGTTYLIGALGEASAAGVPILVLTSDIHRASRGTGALTEIDQLALFSAVTKWRTLVDRAVDIPEAVHDALAAATTGRPGPVAVIVPEDVLDDRVGAARLHSGGADVLPRVRPAASAEPVAAAARVIAAAHRPVIVAGSGVHTSQAWHELIALAERRAMPVGTTIHGKGAIPDCHPLSIGVVGNNGARAYANAVAAEADAVLIVGSRANATDTNSWTAPPTQGVSVVQIDIAPERAARNFTNGIGLVGDARVVLTQLAEQLEPIDAAVRGEREQDIAARRRVWLHTEHGEVGEAGETQLLPAEVIAVLSKVLGPQTLVFADPGTPTPNVASYWETTEPGRTVIAPRGHGPMGYAIPGSIGASFARRGRPIVCLTADGSFAMACGELETAVRFNLPVLFVQFTNYSLGWIKMLQHLYTGRRYFGVDPGPIDAVGVAKACGMAAERVTDYGRLEELTAAFAADPAPLYLDVEVPHMIEYPPPVSSWIAALEGNAGRPVY